jgi:GT2 family glycosyltransferase
MVHQVEMMPEDSVPAISVCVANYNGEDIISECIESILRQKNAPAFEILVHDDASTDNSLAVIERFDSVRLIKSSENVGFCISNNRMAARARGEYILLLNNDAQLLEDSLATLFEESSKHAHKAVLGLPQFSFETRELVDYGLKLDVFGSSVPIRRPTEKDIAMVIGACIWAPTSLWNRIGGFPEWFETNAEDVYFCCYARFMGYRIYVPGRSGFLHMIGHSLGGGKSEDTRLRISTRRRYFSERNRLFVQWLFYPTWLVPFTTLLNFVVLILEAIVLSAANRKPSLIWEIYIKSQRDAFSMLRTVRAARRDAMRSRVISFSTFFRTFTLIPQKLRLVLVSGVPRT